MSVSWSSKTYHLKGLEVLNGSVNLNDNPLKFGDWSFESSEEGDLIIKNNNIIQAKITCNSNNYDHYNQNRFFMTDPVNIKDCIGLLVSNIDKFYNFDLTQSPCIQLSQPMIKLSKKSHDSSVLGVIVNCEEYNREYSNGAFKTVYNQEDEINRVIVSLSGIGSMWVTDMNGLLENGDFLTTSIIPGYGMRQDNPNLCYNHTWAKITHNCNFEPEVKVLQQPIDFNKNGPVYKPFLNSSGQIITDHEYRMKYINKKGEKCSSYEFEKEFKIFLEKELEIKNKSYVEEDYQDDKLNQKAEIIDTVLKNPNRTVFRACLVGYLK